MTQQPQQPQQPKKSFWTTLPGILSGVAALLTAAGGLLGILSNFGVIKLKPQLTPTAVVQVTASAEPTTAPVGVLTVAPTAEPTVAPAAQVTAAPTTVGLASPAPQTTPASVTTPALPETREATIWALAASSRTQTSEAAGICHAATVTIRHKDESGLRVGFFNENVEGTGPMWRASGWTAVTLSSLLLGVNPERFEYSFETGLPYLDGPSAGGLTTIGVLAALLGDTVRQDAAMTGTINPDGTIGPVGGIPHKLTGAAAAGKTLVLIPTGQATGYDENLEQQVDLLEAGRQFGLEVRPVANVFEAYQIMTGRELPRPQPTGTVQLPARALEKMRASAATWLSRYQAARDRFDTLGEEARTDREPLYGDEQALAAQQAMDEGLVAVAHQRAWEAALDGETSLEAATLDQISYEQGFDGQLTELKALSSRAQGLPALVSSLRAEQPRTAGDVVALMDGWGNLAVAWGYKMQGDSLYSTILAEREAGTAEDDLLDLVYEGAYDYVVASLYLDMTRDSLNLGMGFGKSPAPEPRRVAIMAELLRRAADANLALFDSVIVAPQADEAGVSLEVMQSRYRAWDEDYRTGVYAGWGLQDMGVDTWPEEERSLAVLGSSLTAWAESALAMAKHYSLDAELDEDGNLLEFGRQGALAEMLDLAQARAGELVTLMRDEEPVLPQHYAENARIWRQGGPTQQLVSLYYNWQAAVEAQMLAYFTGAYGEAVQGELERAGRSADLLRLWDLPSR